jgi:hypothetical protein
MRAGVLTLAPTLKERQPRMRLIARKTPFALGMLSMLVLTGCATTTATVGTNRAACAVWAPVSWSAKDTDQTIREAKINNARRAAWCSR